MTIPEQEILNVKNIYTIVGGRIVFEELL
jgi:hypothetical protein